MKTLKKIVCLEHEPFSFRKKDNYFLDELAEKGIEFEYWALANVLSYMKNVSFNYGTHPSCVKTFKTYGSFLDELSGLDSCTTALIVEVGFFLPTFGLFEVIQAKKFFWVKIGYYLNPGLYLSTVNSKDSFGKMLKRRFLGFLSKPQKLWQLIQIKRAVNKGLDMPDILFISGNNRIGIPKAKKTVSINYFDIEVFERARNASRLLDYDYILFLDIMLTNHPDIKWLGLNNNISPESYFVQMRCFFNRLEKLTGMPVVIASHPKADYKNGEFGDRQCIKHKTAELSKDASLILTHGSLSICFSLLARKPLIYIYSDTLFKESNFLIDLYNRLVNASDILQVPKINIEDEAAIIELPVVSNAAYSSYLDAVFYAEDKERSNFDIFFNELNKHFIS